MEDGLVQSTGMSSNNCSRVLILVVMEDGLVHLWSSCCIYIITNDVLILVVMEDGLVLWQTLLLWVRISTS